MRIILYCKNLKVFNSKLLSSINEVIRPVLNFLFYFNEKISQVQKAQNIKHVYKKYLGSNIKSLTQFSFLTNFVQTIQFFNQFRLENLVY